MKGKIENLQNYNGKTEYFKLKGLKWNNNESTGNNNNKSKSMERILHHMTIHDDLSMKYELH
jgi:hypothetical protein